MGFERYQLRNIICLTLIIIEATEECFDEAFLSNLSEETVRDIILKERCNSKSFFDRDCVFTSSTAAIFAGIFSILIVSYIQIKCHNLTAATLMEIRECYNDGVTKITSVSKPESNQAKQED